MGVIDQDAARIRVLQRQLADTEARAEAAEAEVARLRAALTAEIARCEANDIAGRGRWRAGVMDARAVTAEHLRSALDAQHTK